MPGSYEDVKTLLRGFLQPGADRAAMTNKLRPAKAEYDAVFEPELANKLEALRTPEWNAGIAFIPLSGDDGGFTMDRSTTDELKGPGGLWGYKQVADKLKPGLTVYEVTFIGFGSSESKTVDGLVHVNGNWRLFPKPWQALK